MSRKLSKPDPPSSAPGSLWQVLGKNLSAALLSKLAKHLVVLACLMIVTDTARGSTAGQLNIFLVIALAALLHSIGVTLQRRFTPEIPRPKTGL